MSAAAVVLLGAACVVGAAVGAARIRVVPVPPGVAIPAAASGTFVIRDVRLFDGSEVVERTSVLVREGKVAEVGTSLRIDAATTIVEGAGRTLIPGLIDSHTHAFGDALERALVFGVTTELDMFTDHQRPLGADAGAFSVAIDQVRLR